jgi:AmmeMemoRadiSam system protein B/AmmeMemoRadiSam system protein A
MKPLGLWLASLGLVVAGCGPATSQQPAARAAQKTRPAVVAGLFYPGEADQLRTTVDRLLAQAKPAGIQNLRALVCPHAGYEYSGRTAAAAYKQLAGQTWQRAIVLAPSHYALFRGAALTDCDALATPLGTLRVARLTAELAKTAPFSVNPSADVRRPGWAAQSPSTPAGPESPLTWEHALEVQLPFLQRALPAVEVVPVVLGDVEPADVARTLAKHLDLQTLLIASSDLSHFYPETDARRLDNACVRAICDLDVAKMADQEACGKGPILVVMHLARQKHWKTKLLDQSTSADASGDRSRVVGYAAIAFYEPGPAKPAAKAEYSPDLRQYLLQLARESVKQAVAGAKQPAVDAARDPRLRAVRACFVTLTKRGELRGCIGNIFPREPLGEAVVHMARAAATEDPRFPPVSQPELAEIAIEISVLTVPQPLRFQGADDLLAKLRPGVDGVVLKFDGGQATFLPQVWEQLPGKTEFLAHLSRKAGQADDAWRHALREVLTYQVEAFHEAQRQRAEK